MKPAVLAVTAAFYLASPTMHAAERQSVTEQPAKSVGSSTLASTAANPGTPRTMPGMGRMHKGKGHQGMGHGGMQHGKGHHGKHRQVVQRLDLIEARLAKIEAMLEILMRR